MFVKERKIWNLNVYDVSCIFVKDKILIWDRKDLVKNRYICKIRIKNYLFLNFKYKCIYFC